MADVHESFASVFAYGLLFEQIAQTQQDAFQPSIREVRTTIEHLLEHDEAAKELSQKSQSEYDVARFAVVAWINETILRHSKGQFYNEWLQSPLPYKNYDVINGGSEFFRYLTGLQPNQVISKTIYHRCLILGFRGRYQDDPDRLSSIQQQLAQELFSHADGVQSSDTLTSQPYKALSDRIVSKPLVWTERLRKAARALLVAAPLMLLLVKLIDSQPDHRGTFPSRVKAILDAKRPCTKITYGIDESARRVALKGWLPSVAVRDEISSALRQVGAQQVDVAALDIVPNLFCDILELLAPYQVASPSGVSMVLKKGTKTNGHVTIVAESATSFCKGDVLVIASKLPPFASHVYINYYDTQGRVLHVFPNREDSQNLKQPQALFEIGRAIVPDKPLTIDLPPGRDLVTVIASKAELLPKSEFMASADSEFVLAVKPITSYLAILQKLRGVSPSDLVAMFTFLQNKGECER